MRWSTPHYFAAAVKASLIAAAVLQGIAQDDSKPAQEPTPLISSLEPIASRG